MCAHDFITLKHGAQATSNTHGTLRVSGHTTRHKAHNVALPSDQQHRLSFPTIKQLETPNRKITFENLRKQSRLEADGVSTEEEMSGEEKIDSALKRKSVEVQGCRETGKSQTEGKKAKLSTTSALWLMMGRGKTETSAHRRPE